MGHITFDYYYGKEGEQFTFFRIPKLLITDSYFKNLSSGAKLLYGLLLDRMGLSIKNKWFDEENRVYIKYGIKAIAEDLSCSSNTATAMLRELEDIGLISLVKRNGKPTIIYVKNFVNRDSASAENELADMGESKNSTEHIDQEEKPSQKLNQCKNSTDSKNEPVQKMSRFKNSTGSENEAVQDLIPSNYCDTAISDFEGVPAQNLRRNNNNTNNTELNKIYPINPQAESTTLKVHVQEQMDEMDQINADIVRVRENVSYDVYMNWDQYVNKQLFRELYELVCDVLCSRQKSIRIGNVDYPYQRVRDRFLQLNSTHFEYIIDCMNKYTNKVNNIRSYMLTALFNAP